MLVLILSERDTENNVRQTQRHDRLSCLQGQASCDQQRGSGHGRDGERRELVCPRCRLAFEVRHDIPVMLRNAARSLSDNEARHYSERSAALDPK